jgi:hypothetical protein
MSKGLFPTSKENIAINLVFEWMEESRFNRTYDDYMDIAARIPKLEACVAHVNQRLKEIAESGRSALRQICYFEAGHKNIVFEPYPFHVKPSGAA